MSSFEVLAFDALQELNTRYGNRLDEDASIRWLESHSALYERRMEFPLFPLNGSEWKLFSSIYSELQHLVGYFQYTGMCEIALLDLGQIDIQEETQLLDWLIRYEEFGLSMEIFYAVTCFQNLETEKDGYIPLFGDPSINIKTSDYSHIVDFLSAFSFKYWQIIEEYAVREGNGQNTEKQELYYGPVTKSLKKYVDKN
jgi:hypothetical protein